MNWNTKMLMVPTLLVLCLLMSGCRCRNCNQPGFFQPLSGFGSPRVNPPGTFSYRNPGTAPSGNPYYNPNATANLNGVLPQGNLPANNNAPNQGNPAWRSAGTPTSTLNPASQNLAPPAGYPTNMTTLASNSTLINTDYRTARRNANQDPTRLPVNDATAVRAPARFSPNNVNFASNQPIQIQGQYQYSAQPQLYGVPNGVLANSSTAVGLPRGSVQTNWQPSGTNNLNR